MKNIISKLKTADCHDHAENSDQSHEDGDDHNIHDLHHHDHHADNEKGDFEVSDIESLQDARIDNDLLEDHFIRRKQKDISETYTLVNRYAKTYGYTKIPRVEVQKRKIKILEERSKKYMKALHESELQIKDIRDKIKMTGLMKIPSKMKTQ